MTTTDTTPLLFPQPPAPGQHLGRSHFAYPLPDARIAQQGLVTRSAAKLLHYQRRDSSEGITSTITDAAFSDLPARLPANSLLVLNTTKVFPSRILGQRQSGGKVELFLLNPDPTAEAEEESWAMVKPLKKLAEGEQIQLPAGASATIVRKEPGRARVRVNGADGQVLAGEELHKWLGEHGIVPLPPYIAREGREQHDTDLSRYQTVYAEQSGSVAAPTAGLHFDEATLAALKAAGHDIATVTLHVGAGTFLPVKTEQISSHTMHGEYYKVAAESLAAIDAARAAGRPIIAVGTTSFRCLESLRRLAGDGPLAPLAPYGGQWRSTELFVYEEQRDRRFTDHFFAGILTNFHQPESTLLMLMAALIGYDELMTVYRHALAEDYRFLSYGDSGLYLF